MRFRFDRGGLIESLATTVEWQTKKDLIAILKREYDWIIPFDDDILEVKYYIKDTRPQGWGETWIVTGRQGVYGYTDGPLP